VLALLLEMRRTRDEVAGLRQQFALLNVQAQRQDQRTMVVAAGAVTGLATSGAAADATERQAADDAEYAAPDQFTRSA
jgi:hypothetical protein